MTRQPMGDRSPSEPDAGPPLGGAWLGTARISENPIHTERIFRRTIDPIRSIEAVGCFIRDERLDVKQVEAASQRAFSDGSDLDQLLDCADGISAVDVLAVTFRAYFTEDIIRRVVLSGADRDAAYSMVALGGFFKPEEFRDIVAEAFPGVVLHVGMPEVGPSWYGFITECLREHSGGNRAVMRIYEALVDKKGEGYREALGEIFLANFPELSIHLMRRLSNGRDTLPEENADAAAALISYNVLHSRESPLEVTAFSQAALEKTKAVLARMEFSTELSTEMGDRSERSIKMLHFNETGNRALRTRASHSQAIVDDVLQAAEKAKFGKGDITFPGRRYSLPEVEDAIATLGSQHDYIATTSTFTSESSGEIRRINFEETGSKLTHRIDQQARAIITIVIDGLATGRATVTFPTMDYLPSAVVQALARLESEQELKCTYEDLRGGHSGPPQTVVKWTEIGSRLAVTQTRQAHELVNAVKAARASGIGHLKFPSEDYPSSVVARAIEALNGEFGTIFQSGEGGSMRESKQLIITWGGTGEDKSQEKIPLEALSPFEQAVHRITEDTASEFAENWIVSGDIVREVTLAIEASNGSAAEKLLDVILERRALFRGERGQTYVAFVEQLRRNIGDLRTGQRLRQQLLRDCPKVD